MQVSFVRLMKFLQNKDWRALITLVKRSRAITFGYIFCCAREVKWQRFEMDPENETVG